MAVKSTITIDVDQADFASFYTKFAQFKATLENTPEAWRKVSASAAVAKAEFQKTAKAAQDQADAMDGSAQSVSKLRQATEATERSWANMSKSTATTAKNIDSATSSLMKWAGIAGMVLSGPIGLLAGAAGLAIGGGIAAFHVMSGAATRTSNERTAALGVGSTPGRQAAADTAYGRFVGQGFSSKVASLQHDVNGVASLQRLLPGMSAGQIANADPNDLIGALVQSGRQKARNTPQGQLFNDPTLQGVFTHEQINTLASSGIADSEVGDARKNYDQNKSKFDYKNPRAWQDFERTLDTSERAIKTTFVDRLTVFSEPVRKLTESFTSFSVKLINSDAFGFALEKLNEAAEWLAKEVDNDEFRQGLNNFIRKMGDLVASIGDLAGGVISFAKWLGFDVSSYSGTGSTGTGGYGGVSGYAKRGGDTPHSAGGGGSGGKFQAGPPGRSQVTPPGSTAPNLTALIDQAAKSEGGNNSQFIARAMEGIRAGESRHGNTYDINRSAKEESYGPFQLNRKGGLGTEFEKDNPGLDLSDPHTIPAQTRWVARHLREEIEGNWFYTPGSEFYGYKGVMDADPSWGNSGYEPVSDKPYRSPLLDQRSRSAPLDPSSVKHVPPLKLTVKSAPGSNPIISASQLSGAFQ